MLLVGKLTERNWYKFGTQKVVIPEVFCRGSSLKYHGFRPKNYRNDGLLWIPAKTTGMTAY